MSEATSPARTALSGAARVYALLGDPLHKTRSPEHFNALLAARGIDAALVPMEAASEDFDALVVSLKRVRNLHGFIVTMPYKQEILRHLDALGPTAQAVGAANIARREAGGRWFGDMVDGPGYTGALATRGIAVEGRSAYFVGAGGVARAMAVALAEAGIAALRFTDLEAARAQALAALVAQRYPRVRCESGAAPPEEHDLAINATPLGMRGEDPLPFDVSRLTPRTAVSDVTTKPEVTPLLEAARARGCRVSTGRDMFEAQAVLIARFFGWGD